MSAVEDIVDALVGTPSLTRDEVAAQVGLPLELLTRLWGALGFPEVRADVVAFTERDVQALRDARLIAESRLVDGDGLVALARSLGQSTSRLAEVHAAAFVPAAESDPEQAGALAEAGLPVVARLMEYAWRRHLAASVAGALARSGEDALAVGFVDLVGFTALARGLEAVELDRLVEAFDDTVARTAAAYGVRVVKTLGDGVLLAAAEVTTLAAACLDAVEAVEAAETLPEARAGIALGAVLQRHGDVYGEPVNLASRLTGIARPGSLLCDELAAQALGEAAGWQVKEAGVRSVRGYSRLKTWRVRRSDPVGT